MTQRKEHGLHSLPYMQTFHSLYTLLTSQKSVYTVEWKLPPRCSCAALSAPKARLNCAYLQSKTLSQSPSVTLLAALKDHHGMCYPKVVAYMAVKAFLRSYAWSMGQLRYHQGCEGERRYTSLS